MSKEEIAKDKMLRSQAYYKKLRRERKKNKMKKIFRKEKYITDMLSGIIITKNYEFLSDLLFAISSWVTKCDGKEVINEKINGFQINDSWCEEVEENDNFKF